MARQSAPAIPVLLTRPQAEGESFASALRDRFGDRVRPLVAPLIAPRFLSPSLPGTDYSAVIFTSARAVEASRSLGVPLPANAWCVGKKTASVATAAGFNARSADGDVNDLAEAILLSKPDSRLLYLHGVDTRGNLLEILRNSGVQTDVAIVYAQEPQALSPEADILLSSAAHVVVPLFSPRTAALFRAALPETASAPLHFAAMSAAVADALDGLPREALAIASNPDAPGMLAAVETLLADLPAP